MILKFLINVSSNHRFAFALEETGDSRTKQLSNMSIHETYVRRLKTGRSYEDLRTVAPSLWHHLPDFPIS